MGAKYQHETLGSKTQKEFLGIVCQRISETEKQSLAVVVSGACRDPWMGERRVFVELDAGITRFSMRSAASFQHLR
jgi:hypothetical protein